MMKMFLALVFCFGLFGTGSVRAESFGIAATVNKDAISEADVKDRMKLTFASSGVRDSKKNREKFWVQALNSLIEEQLKIQESERQSLSVTSEEVGNGFKVMADQNKLTTEQFSSVLKQQGIPKQTLLNQIKAQVAWSKVISSVLRPKINVSESDVNAKIDRLKEGMGQTESLVFEIFLPVRTPKEEAKTKQMANQLIQEIKQKRAPFSVVAAQFSKAPSAQNGGSLGWVQDDGLPKELNLVLKSLGEGQISPPVRTLSGFHILSVAKKRIVSEETLPKMDDVLNAIGLERLNRSQERYLADIRSTAFINIRN